MDERNTFFVDNQQNYYMMWPKSFTKYEMDAINIFWNKYNMDPSNERSKSLLKVIPQIKGCMVESETSVKLITQYVYPTQKMFQ